MNRRTFLSLASAGFLSAPLAAEAQLARTLYRISLLGLTPGEDTASLAPLLERPRELNYHEGSNMTFEYLSAEGRPERLRQLAAEVARARPDIVIAGFGTLTAQAAKAASTDIPIVFTLVGDPVGAGLVASLGHPGANVAGLSGLNPDTPYTAPFLKEIHAAAVDTRTSVRVLEARTADQVPRQFEAAITVGVGGLLVVADPLIYSLRRQIPDLSAKARIPAMYPCRDYIAEGGLMSYGFDRPQIYRRAAE